VAICGITTNHCCYTTARFAGNLGYETYFIIDAAYTFDRKGLDRTILAADELSKVTAANLQDEFAEVITTDALVKAIIR
jgi:nicotinamidase-related amidase